MDKFPAIEPLNVAPWLMLKTCAELPNVALPLMVPPERKLIEEVEFVPRLMLPLMMPEFSKLSFARSFLIFPSIVPELTIVNIESN